MRRPLGVDHHGAHRLMLDAVAAGLVAAIVSGVPSTVHALLTGRDPLESSLTAGSLLLGDEQRHGRLLAAGVVSHMSLSVGWALVLAVTLPRRRSALAGGAAGMGIAALDLGLVGRRLPAIRGLPHGRQWADHVAYRLTVGIVLRARRARAERAAAV